MKIASTLPTFEVMDSQQEKKRRAAIAYVLRRRKRGRKLGANSGQVVKSVNRRIRGHMIFKPSASMNMWWRFGMVGLALLICLFPLFIFALPSAPHLQVHHESSPAGLTLLIPAVVLLLLIAGFAAAYIALSIWRFIRSLIPHKKE